MSSPASRAYLPDPVLFESSVAIALSIRPYVEIDFLTSDIPAIEHAVKRLSSDFGIPVRWSMKPTAAITLDPFDGMSKAASMKHLRTLLNNTPGWMDSAAAGMRPRVVQVLEQVRIDEEHGRARHVVTAPRDASTAKSDSESKE